MNRRSFLRTASGTAGAAFAAALAGPQWLRGAVARQANDVLSLGPEKIRLSRLAIGLGTFAGNLQRQMGLQGVADYLKFGFDQGLFFWDTADHYKTHPHVKQALKSIPREKVTILTKSGVSTASEMKADLDRFRQELGTDYIDIFLLHGVHTDNWPEERKGAMEVLSEAKEKGIVRTLGASFHSFGALKAAVKTPWLGVQLVRINPAGVNMDSTDPAAVAALLRQSKAAGKGIIGMKVLGEGVLRNRVDEALHFVLGLDCVDCFTIGAANRGELADLIRRIPANAEAAKAA
jgi:predicted aldo/keto reductase-like oxidoreductase